MIDFMVFNKLVLGSWMKLFGLLKNWYDVFCFLLGFGVGWMLLKIVGGFFWLLRFLFLIILFSGYIVIGLYEVGGDKLK